jgi:hypothetical protein
MIDFFAFVTWVAVMLLIVNFVAFRFSGPLQKTAIRIVRIERKNGSFHFRIQQRDWFGFWRNCSQLIGWDMYAYIEFDDLFKAQEYVNELMKRRKEFEGFKVKEKTEINRYK